MHIDSDRPPRNLCVVHAPDRIIGVPRTFILYEGNALGLTRLLVHDYTGAKHLPHTRELLSELLLGGVVLQAPHEDRGSFFALVLATTFSFAATVAPTVAATTSFTSIVVSAVSISVATALTSVVVAAMPSIIVSFALTSSIGVVRRSA